MRALPAPVLARGRPSALAPVLAGALASNVRAATWRRGSLSNRTSRYGSFRSVALDDDRRLLGGRERRATHPALRLGLGQLVAALDDRRGDGVQRLRATS